MSEKPSLQFTGIVNDIFGVADTRLLKTLMWFRGFETFALFFAGLCCHYIFKINVPYVSFMVSLGLLLLGNILLIVRLNKHWEVTQLELFFNLVADALVLCLFISGTGGASNPFVSLYLVLIALGASILSTILTIVITSFCTCIYSYLFFYLDNHQLHSMYSETDVLNSSFQLHLAGMWANFLLSAVCLTIFIHLLRRTLSRRESEINQKKEQALRNEHILAIGSLAAGAAHELSTPLSTSSLLSENLLKNANNDLIQNDLYLLRDQLQLCNEAVNALRISAANPHSFLLEVLPLKTHLENIFDTWLLLWPAINDVIGYDNTFENFDIAFDRRLQQTILSLLNNASEASVHNNSANVFIELSCHNKQLHIAIYDEGKGVDKQIVASQNQAAQSSKRGGVGLGLMLSHSNMSQLGGEFSLNTATHPASFSQSGTQARLRITLNPHH